MQAGHNTYYSGGNAQPPTQTSSSIGQSAYYQGDGSQIANSPTTQTEPVAFFLFFNCKTTGSSIHRDKIVEIAIQCWPYCENAPVFHSKVDNSGGKRGKRRDRTKKGQKKTSSHPDDTIGHPFPVVWKQLMQWLERILDHATNVIGTQIYPVFVAHHGDLYDFHFLISALEKHGIDLAAMSELDIRFCDPVPLLQQYKEYAHPWLIESRSMALGSLLNDWLPGQFDIGDVYICLGKTFLAAKLYTQTPMYWLLKDFPVYSAKEWIEYYMEVKEYREDKKSLEDNFPPNVPEVQRKFAVRSLLQWGYNWDRLIELYKVCTSPEHFRQELKDCDVKSGAASQLTWKIVDQNLPQDGTRQYKVRIKKNMPPQRYTHLTDRRGRMWILRVKNVLPPCIYSLNDLYVNLPSTNQWKVPENLLLIRYPEAWCPMPGDTPDEDTVIDQLQLGSLTFNSDDNSENSCDSWDEEEDEDAAMRQSLQPVEEYVKEQPAAPPITTLQFGNEASAYNPFADNKKHRDLQSELRKEDKTKVIKSLWESVKEDTKQEPIGFGQTIKFCRPGGSEDQRRKKKDKDDDENFKNRKGQRNKRQNDKGKGERAFGRSQSWTPETGDPEKKKPETNRSQSRTVSCSESWDDEASVAPADPVPNEDGSTTQAKDTAAAHRMINFHLAKNNRKPRNSRSRKNDSRGEAKRQESSQGQEQVQSKLDETSGKQGTGLNNPAKSPGSFSSKLAANNTQTQTWGKGKPDISKSTTTSWGQGKSEATNDTSESKKFPTRNPLSSKTKYPSSWGQGKFDLNKDSSAQGASSSGAIRAKASDIVPSKEEEDWNENIIASPPSAVTNDSTKSDDDKSSVMSLGSVSQRSGRSSIGGSNIRRPRETSKAHIVAQKAKQQEKTSPSTLKSLVQKPPENCLVDSKKAPVTEEGSSQSFVQSKTFSGNSYQTHNARGSHGYRGQNKGAFRNENQSHNLGWSSDRGRKDDRRYQNLSKSINSNLGNSSHGDYQPVVSNHIEESENWDEEVGDDECYGL
ncbi:uncharacterized protein [Amphiura filiformis]|uniref:uncharacterized protein n=1 Tax=Amphiura filiformis TaxID=82378 RepID=UPI003B22357F